MGIIDALKSKLSSTTYQCNNISCNKYFNINDRYTELRSELPSDAPFVDFGKPLGFCSDHCFKVDNDMDNIVSRFTDGNETR